VLLFGFYGVLVGRWVVARVFDCYMCFVVAMVFWVVATSGVLLWGIECLMCCCVVVMMFCMDSGLLLWYECQSV